MNEQLFEDYLREARDEFVMEVNSNEWNTKVRTAAENFLICFDQLRERFLASSNTVAPVDNIVESEEKYYEPEVRNTNEADVASHSCTIGNSIQVFPMDFIKKVKEFARIEARYESGTDKIGFVYLTQLDGILIDAFYNMLNNDKNAPVSDTTEADSSNADGNKKIPSIDWKGLTNDYFKDHSSILYEKPEVFFTWLKTNLHDYIK